MKSCSDYVLPYTARAVHPSGMANSVRLKKNNKYKKDYPTGYIVDLLTLPNRTEIADALLRDATRYFDEQGVNVVRSWMLKGFPTKKYYTKTGL